MSNFGCVNNTIRLHSGCYFDLADPRPDHFHLTDIAVGLSHICRFGGQCGAFYSVAEHSVWCVEAATELAGRDLDSFERRSVLLHDAAEAFIGDMVKPLKVMMPEYKEVERRIEAVIAKKYGCDFSLPIVKEADMAMLIHERNSLWRKADGVKWTGEDQVKRLNTVLIHQWEPTVACLQFFECAKLAEIKDE